MKKQLLLIFTLCMVITMQAKNYYLSSSTGNDSRPTNNTPGTAWQTIGKFNTIASSILPGDSVLFKWGDSFYGQLLVTKSGTSTSHIVYGTYGAAGSTPTIKGFVQLSGWTLTSAGIYETTCVDCGSKLNSVAVNYVPVAKGRYPNANAPNGGYLNFESHSAKTSITDNQLSPTPNWSGAELVLRTQRWAIDRNVITSHSGGTLNYTVWDANAYEPTNGFGYFIQNSLSTLDQFGEWYYNPTTKKVYMYFGASSPSSYNVRASTVNNLININNLSYIDVIELAFEQANEDGIKITNSAHIYFLWAQVLSSGLNGFSVDNSTDVDIVGSLVEYSNVNGIDFTSNCNSNEISYSTIRNTGLLTGMSKSGNTSSQGIFVRGSNNYIFYNRVINTGYIGIEFYGSNNTISKNFVNNFNITKDDGGGIYTYGDPTSTNKIIEYNTVLNGVGARYGTTDTTAKPAYGIYLDDNTGNVNVRYNTVAHCAADGIFLHMAHDITCTNNTIYNTASAFRFGEDQSCCLIRNNTVTNNIAMAKTTSQLAAAFTTYANDITSFGTFNNNYYCRPLDDILTINSSFYTSGVQTSLEQDLAMWQAYSGFDASSNKSPLKYYPYSITGSGAERHANSTFDAASVGFSSWAPTGGTIAVTKDVTSKITGANSARIQYTNTGSATASAHLYIGAVDAGKKYVVSFKLLGVNNNKLIQIYLQQQLSPWQTASQIRNCKLSNAVTANELLITATKTDANVLLVFDLDPQDGVIYLDDVSIKEVTAITFTNPDDYIRFEYNETDAAKNISLGSTYKDVTGTSYSGTVSIPAFSSKIFLKVAGSHQPSGISALANNSSFELYPNPSHGVINILLPPSESQLSEIQLYDISGRLVHSKTVQLNNVKQTIQLEVNQLPEGMYIVKLHTAEGVYQKKFVKAN